MIGLCGKQGLLGRKMRVNWVLRSGSGILRQGCLRSLHSVPPGAFLGPLSGKGELGSHPLDTHQDKYIKTLKEVVFKTCTKITPDVPSYQERLLRVMDHTTPSFSYSLGFLVELGYRILTPMNQQTEENLERMRILRGAYELSLCVAGELDDIVDNNDVKLGKPAWHTICPGGIPAAIYDGLIMSHLPLYVVKRFFHDHPNYAGLLFTFSEMVRNMSVGQLLDVLQQSDNDKSYEKNRVVAKYKTGSMKRGQGRLGFILGGVTDENILKQTDPIFFLMGEAYQAYNDFMDYYLPTDATGKTEMNDIQQGASSWVAVTAMKHFTKEQKELFLKNYGSSDAEKQATVSRLYDDINMPQLFVDEQNLFYKQLQGLINQLEHEKIAEVCRSAVDWFIGRPNK